MNFGVRDSSVLVQGMTVLVDYPESQVTIPDTNGHPMSGVIVNVQSGALSTPIDLQYGLSEQIAGLSHPLNAAVPLFKINFVDCQGATPPTAADFTCTVQSAVDPLGLPQDGVTCSVTAG